MLNIPLGHRIEPSESIPARSERLAPRQHRSTLVREAGPIEDPLAKSERGPPNDIDPATTVHRERMAAQVQVDNGPPLADIFVNPRTSDDAVFVEERQPIRAFGHV